AKTGEGGRDAVTKKGALPLAAPGEIGREGVVGRVHAAERHEVAGRHQPRRHGRVDARDATRPCSAPARNQNCKPICVTNGVNVKMSAAVPRLAARTTAAHARTLASASVRAIWASFASVTASAPRES